MKLHLKNNSYPLPTEEEIAKMEANMDLRLPADYREFMKKYGACEVEECVFDSPYEGMVLEAIMGLVPNYVHSPMGYYDIEVVLSEIDESMCDIPAYAALNDDEDAQMEFMGIVEDKIKKGEECDVDERENLIPIASLFAGNFLCLDYRKSRSDPTVCYWDHEQSLPFAAYTEPVAESFTEFLHMLHSMDTDGPQADMNEPIEIVVPKELTWQQKTDIKFGRVEQAMQIAENLRNKNISDEVIYNTLCNNEEVLFHGPRIYNGGVKLEVGKFYQQGNVLARCIKSSDAPVSAPLLELEGTYMNILQR